MKKMLSVLILGLLLGLFSQICLADSDNERFEPNFHGSIEAIGYFQPINGQEWNLTLWYEFTDEVKVGINENIHNWSEEFNLDTKYNTEVFLIYKLSDQLEFYFVPYTSEDNPYFKVKYSF
jgi:hypothetical protein